MKIFKKNQIIIYVIALMLITAGYLSYTTDNEEVTAGIGMETADVGTEAESETKTENIGDAQLVSSNDIVNQNGEKNINSNETENSLANSSDIANITNEAEENDVEKTEEQQESKITEDNQSTNQIEDNAQSTSNTISNEYFTNSKLERDTMYSQMLETYEKILNSSNALETQKQSATEEITKINNTKNSIMICENLIGTKGFQNNVIFVNGNSITVIVGATELKQEEVAQIQNIIAREMQANIENIHIAIK